MEGKPQLLKNEIPSPRRRGSIRLNKLSILLAGLGLLFASALIPLGWSILSGQDSPLTFSGERAYQDVVYQVGLGPRTPGSEAHRATLAYIQGELLACGWSVDIQQTTFANQPVSNLVARHGMGRPWIILGAHYDSRLLADRDPDPALRTQPVPGANDGASGVAVLLEIARALPRNLGGSLWLVFFDAEDNGNLPGWDWILGSQAFVSGLAEKPDAAVIIDMIGDADLNIYRELSSDPALVTELWSSAAAEGYQDQFIDLAKHTILDDHTPFLKAGIPAVDIIDFEYPYWHTTQDTPDKVAPASLSAVGETLIAWLEMRLGVE